MKKFDAVITRIEEIVLSFSVLIMAFILIGGVISRTVFNSSWTFTEEVGTALNIVVTFFGIGYCARQARHISMSVVYDLVGLKAKKVITCITSLLTGIIMFYLTYLAIYYVMSVYELGRVTAALRIPMWIIYLSIPLGFLLGGAEYIRTFVRNMKEKDEIYISSKLKIGENMDDVGANNEEVHS